MSTKNKKYGVYKHDNGKFFVANLSNRKKTDVFEYKGQSLFLRTCKSCPSYGGIIGLEIARDNWIIVKKDGSVLNYKGQEVFLDIVGHRTNGSARLYLDDENFVTMNKNGGICKNQEELKKDLTFEALSIFNL